MSKVLGIIGFEDNSIRVEGLSDYRPVSSISFLGRYRLIDFVLSNMSNSGIKRFQIYVKEKPRSVFEHVGIGQQYNINSKQGKMRIMYGEAPRVSAIYNTDITAFLENLQWIEEDNSEYVVVAPSHFIYVQDFGDVLNHHIESGSDITVLYKNTEKAKTEFQSCTTLTLDRNKRVINRDTNRGQASRRAISLDAFVMKKKLFTDLIKRAHETSSIYWLKEMIFDNLFDLNIGSYPTKSDVYAITDLTSFYNAHMALVDPAKSTLFKPDWPIYTRTSDSPPTLYSKQAKVTKSLVANGAHIEGEVVNSVIGRGCFIAKGAKVVNSVILPNTTVGEDVSLHCAVVDKHVNIQKLKEVTGEPHQLVYIKRHDSI